MRGSSKFVSGPITLKFGSKIPPTVNNLKKETFFRREITSYFDVKNKD